MSVLKLISKPIIGFFIRTVISLIQSVLGLFIKTDKSIIIACPQGLRFSDNPKYLFQYMYNEGHDVYILTNNSETFDVLNKKYQDSVLYGLSLNTLFKFVSASVLIYAYGKRDFYPFQMMSNKTSINLWHSISIKRIGIISGMGFLNKRKLISESRKIDYFVAHSEIEGETLQECYNLKPQQIAITGTPRNDYLISGGLNEELLLNNPFLKERTILYAPTFRRNGATNIVPFSDYSLKTLNDFLSKTNTYLLIRKHHSEWYSGNEGYQSIDNYSHIKNAGHGTFPEVQELLPYVDILVTDYSGIYFDYLLLDRPIIFAPYDIDSFSGTPGFFFDFEENTPGRKVYSQKEFLEEIEMLIDGKDQWKSKRKHVRDKFHTYQDGKSSKRIVDLITEKLD